jgi:serine/threonine protein kinase
MAYKKGSLLRTAFEAYTVQTQRGAGPSGDVYEVVNSCGQPKAVKVLRDAGPEALKPAANDFNFCFRTHHKNIISVLDCGLTGGKAPFYVMPLYARNLRDCMRNGIREDKVLGIFGQILDAVEAAHLHGIRHRALKPENILLDEAGEEVVVADFGTAPFEEVALWSAASSDASDRLKEFPYAAPEQKYRGGHVDAKADVFALGLILKEIFTGTVPDNWGQPTIEEFSRNFAYLDWVVARMTKDDPAKRSSVTQVKRELIARGIEFLSIQRLSTLTNEVIRETDVDDPLLRNPITIQAVDFKGATLFLTLSVTPPAHWVAAFHNLRPRTTYAGFGPERFIFLGRIGQVSIGRGHDPQQLFESAKSFVEGANRVYAEETIAAHRRDLEEERAKRRARIASEERRLQVLSRLRL